MEVDIGITEGNLEKIADQLRVFLATSYVLYMKTQHHHWNVKGRLFYSLHILLEKQYEDLAEAVDEIAERIASLGFYVEGSSLAFAKASKIQEALAPKEELEIINELVQDHEVLSKIGRKMIASFQELGDEISADLLIGRLAFHEKAAWMLRSHLQIK